jgi:hypothetical protein
MHQKHALNVMKDLFNKKQVVDMSQLRSALNNISRVSVFRYLQKMDYLTSYTHNGKYYTLSLIAQFDSDGLWHYGDIGFSSSGTLIDTLAHVIIESESGKTNAELEAYCTTRVQDALRTLLNKKRIMRIKPANRNLYVSPDPIVSEQQTKKRTAVGGRKRLPDWIIAEILVETIRSCPISPSIHEVTRRLSKRGSLITQEQVRQVFEENELEKKTPD